MKLLIRAVDEHERHKDRIQITLYDPDDKSVTVMLLLTERGAEELLRVLNTALDALDEGKYPADAVRVEKL